MDTKYAALYKDHREARSQHVAWRQDIEHSRAKNSQVLALLDRIETLIRNYDAELLTHTAEIGAYEIETQLDEELIMQQERLEGSPVSEELAAIRQHFEDDLEGLHLEAQGYDLFGQQKTADVTPLIKAVRELI
ncbi:MAG TPA: hypothetical protein PKE64_16690 [Anaerolineae bacterium]|nr:hypothetical protein [Anaerolineae bacterium]HMR65648.1 hypothetical protein [Anaerolineae bacterium]